MKPVLSAKPFTYIPPPPKALLPSPDPSISLFIIEPPEIVAVPCASPIPACIKIPPPDAPDLLPLIVPPVIVRFSGAFDLV